MTTRCDNRRNPAGNPPVIAAALALIVGMVGVACSSAKSIHNYEPQVVPEEVEATSSTRSDLVLAIEDFSAGSAYDDQRMVYRSAKYRFDYYHFHRWAAPPGMLVSDTLREVYRGTGAFRSVVGGYDSRADVILSGRVIAFEEVDKKEKWYGHVVLNLRVRDSRTGELLWNATVEQSRPLAEKSPIGLAAAISEALTAIGVETTDAIVQAARQRPTRADGDSSTDGGMFGISDGKQTAPESSEKPATSGEESAESQK